MIPKKIHYCWFGHGEKPDLAKKCIASWKKFCPDYEIIEWNEDNFDVYQNKYMKYCYDKKKYAFLSDYVRLFVINQYGGIYFDTDVEVIRKFDFLLEYNAFYAFEDNKYIATGLGFGAEANHPTVCAMLDEYMQLLPNADNSYPFTACPALNTKALLAFGLQLNGEYQRLNDTLILPSDYMNPYDTTTGILNKTKNTLSIHWYSMSWLPKYMGIRMKVTRLIRRIIYKMKND